MFTYNITFVVAPEKEPDLLEFLRDSLIPKVCNPESPTRNPFLKKIVEAGGEKPGKDYGRSIALSVDFSTEEAAHLWNDHILLPALSDFNIRFGQHSVFFITLLENLSL